MKDYLLSRYMERDGCWIWTAAKNSREEVAEMYGLHPVYVSKLTNGRERQRVAA